MPRKKALGEIIEWREGPDGKQWPVTPAEIIYKYPFWGALVQSPLNGVFHIHGGDPDKESTKDPKHFFARAEGYFFKIVEGKHLSTKPTFLKIYRNYLHESHQRERDYLISHKEEGLTINATKKRSHNYPFKHFLLA